MDKLHHLMAPEEREGEGEREGRGRGEEGKGGGEKRKGRGGKREGERTAGNGREGRDRECRSMNT